MDVISSLSNRRVRDAVRLRNGRHRRRRQQFLVDGAREMGRAIDSGLTVLELFVSETALASGKTDRQSAATARLISRAEKSGSLTCLADPVFAKLCFGDRNEGLVGRFATPDRSLQRLALPAEPLVVVLDSLEKPGNIGAVFRTADAAGVDAVLCAEMVGDLFNPNLIRASLGTVFAMPSAIAPRPEIQQWLRSRSIRPLAARVEAGNPLWESQLTGPLALVLGTEAEGLDASWNCAGIRVPMAGIADSLNVSVTAAVLIFEAMRQRSIASEYPHRSENR
ncbi:MAG: TrmH family RNA methyltransferase [Pirellulaceae bacterium]